MILHFHGPTTVHIHTGKTGAGDGVAESQGGGMDLSQMSYRVNVDAAGATVLRPREDVGGRLADVLRPREDVGGRPADVLRPREDVGGTMSQTMRPREDVGG